MEGILNTAVEYFVVQEKVVTEATGETAAVTEVRPLFYNATDRTYAPTSDYKYATVYLNQADAEKRRDRLALLAELDEEAVTPIKYYVIKRTVTNEVLAATEV